MMIAGSPDTVRAAFEAQIAECGYEYPILQMAFGSLTHIEAMRSLRLFAEEVMPALRN